MSDDDDLLDLMARLRRDGRPYALARVVRTVAAAAVLVLSIGAVLLIAPPW